MEMRKFGVQFIANLTATMMFLYQGMWDIVSSTEPVLTRLYDGVICSQFQIKRHSKNITKQQRNIKCCQALYFIAVMVIVVFVYVLAQPQSNIEIGDQRDRRSTGSEINRIGDQRDRRSTGSEINGIGDQRDRRSTGSEINGIGDQRDQESDILQIGIEDQSNEAQCARYWTELTAEFNLNELDLNQMSHATPGPALNGGECGRTSLKCEGSISWNGTTMTATNYPGQKWVHPPIIDMIESFANWSGLEPFEFDEHTHDGGACVSSKDRPIVLHSEPPPEWNMETVLWPIYGNMYTEIPKWLRNPPDGAEDPWKSKTRCIWRGSTTGGAGGQAACNRGRNSCKREETDRQCVVRLKPDKLDAAFGKPADYWRHNCIVSVDGNAWAGSLKPSLVYGKLALRVGGFNASSRTRLSSYEWYEPMLKAGVHYIQTTIDDLEATIEDIDVMDEDELRQIAARGHEAFLAISNETSLACYGKLELQRVHKKMQKKV